MLTVTYRAEAQMLQAVLALARRVHLYVNEVGAARFASAAEFQEPDGGGYAPRDLAPDDWRVQTGARASATYPPVTWRFEAGVGHVRGYYVTDAAGELLWSEPLAPGPFLAANPGDSLTLDLSFDLGARARV